jgi:hypothetical protein
MADRSEGAAGAELAVFTVVLPVAVVVVLAVAFWFVLKWTTRLLLFVLRAVVRLYRARGDEPAPVGRALRTAVGGLVVAWLVAAILLLSPGTATYGVYLASWGFLAFAAIVVGSGFSPPPGEPERLEGAWNLEEYLGPSGAGPAEQRSGSHRNGRVVGSRTWRW